MTSFFSMTIWFQLTCFRLFQTSPVLYLRNVKVEDAGLYSCLVSNHRDSLLTWAMVDVVSVLHKNRFI